MEMIAGNVTIIATRSWQVRNRASSGHAIPGKEAFARQGSTADQIRTTMVHAANLQSKHALTAGRTPVAPLCWGGEKLVRRRADIVTFLTRFDH